ncbi:MAG: MGH1-like glycoside hydrolase domain-containing protein [Saprospiraceae bacterium]
MNQLLLQAAKVMVERHAAIPVEAPHAALASIAMAYFDIDKASTFLEQALEEANFPLPLQGVALAHLYQQAKDKQAIQAKLTTWYQTIVQRHRFWYEHQDPTDEGLPLTPAAEGAIQDPLFLALLVWSNENLIQVGHLLQTDVLEIIQWNELTIFGVNEKLWHAEKQCYQPFNLQTNHFIEGDFVSSFAPLLGEIPTQHQAERLLRSFRRALKQIEQLNIWECWLLQLGLRRYDFTELADELREQWLSFIEENGFHENFAVQTGKPFLEESGQSLLAASLTIDLFKRC